MFLYVLNYTFEMETVCQQVCVCGYGCPWSTPGSMSCPLPKSVCGEFSEDGAEVTRMWWTWASNFSHPVCKYKHNIIFVIA